MRRVSIATLLLAVLALALCYAEAPRAQSASPQQPPSKAQAQQQPPQFEFEVRLVNVVFSVLNRRNKFITDLKKENFKVLEDDKPQDVTNFSRETDLPLRVGLLLDTSNSIRDRLKFEQEAAIDFLGNVLRRHKDLAFLMTFDSEPQLIHDFTDNVGDLTQAILKQRAGGGTALHDALYEAAARHMARAPLPAGENPSVRRVLIVISDGEDSVSNQYTRTEAIEIAQRNDVVIYTISTSTDWMTNIADSARGESAVQPKKTFKTDGDKVLELISGETGGRAFFPYRIDDLAQSFLDISDELRSQYSLAYTPTNRLADGKFRRIRIEPDRRGLTVLARKGYFAPRLRAPRPTDQ
jgi:VWFA-related protein